MGRAPAYSRLASEALWALRSCCTAALAAHALKESPRGSLWGPSAALPPALQPGPHPGTSDAPAGPYLRLLKRGPPAESQMPTVIVCFVLIKQSDSPCPLLVSIVFHWFPLFSIGCDRFSIGFDRFSIGFDRFSIGFDDKPYKTNGFWYILMKHLIKLMVFGRFSWKTL